MLEKKHNPDDYCPRCRSEYDLSVLSVVVSLANWPFIILVSFAVILFGEFLELGLPISLVSGVIATAPLFLLVGRKRVCSTCGIEFEATSKKSKI